MGSEADELEGRIMLGLLSREGFFDTDELSGDTWLALIYESQKIRREQFESDEA